MIAGNHELSFDPSLRGQEQELGAGAGGRCGHHLPTSPLHGDQGQEKKLGAGAKEELRGCTYLEDEAVEIEGLKIYGGWGCY